MKKILVVLCLVTAASGQTQFTLPVVLDSNSVISYNFGNLIDESFQSMGDIQITWDDTLDIIDKVVWPQGTEFTFDGLYWIPSDTSVVPDTVFASRFKEGNGTKRLRLRYDKRKQGDYEKRVDGRKRVGRRIDDPFEDLDKQDRKTRHKTKKERKRNRSRKKARRIK